MVDELMAFEAVDTQDHHRVSVLWALVRCFPPGATDQFRGRGAGGLNLQALRQYTLPELVIVALKWCRDRPQKDAEFVKDLRELSETSAKTVGAVSQQQQQSRTQKRGAKWCDTHGECAHETRECKGIIKSPNSPQGGANRGAGRGGRSRGGRSGGQGRSPTSTTTDNTGAQGTDQQARKVRKPRLCFVCGEEGHLALGCPKRYTKNDQEGADPKTT